MSARNWPVSDRQASPATSTDSTNVGELFEFVKTYARQETLGPIKGAGRWLGYGAIGALLLGVGLMMLLLGLLRVLQTETDAFDGSWSWVPYAIVLVAAGAIVALSFSRINRATLAKERR